MLSLAWKFFSSLFLAIAALALIWLSLPISTTFSTLLTLAVLCSLVFVWWRLDTQPRLSQLGQVHSLILVGGPAAQLLIQQSKDFREGCNHRWLLIETPDSLVQLCESTPDLQAACLILMVEPDSDDLLETTCTNISNWRFALESSQRLLGYQLPLSLLLLNALHQTPGALLPSYCIWLACKTQEQAYKQLAQRLKTLTQHALDSAPASRAESMKTLVEIHISANFIQKYVLPRLMPDQAYRHSPLLVDINWMDAGRRVPQAEWRDAAHRISALRPTSSQQPWPVNPPLPENLTQYLPRLISCPPWLRNLAWLGIWLALAFAIASASSAWNNLQQIKLASSALQAYYLLKPDQEPALGKTVQYVQTLQTSFAKETEHGTPLRLGVGLYQGNTVNLKLNDAVRSYHPPKPTPQVVRLDNTALFDSSKAVLKAESKLALQSVLVWIQANPSKRVLIDGHTDNVGKAAANIRLSEERARAVRDWLVSASTFPITHFSVQGLGDTQPLASNNDEQGRSKNRRVEITLVQPPDSQENTPPTAGAQ